jgi:Flp pilus assembly protein TadD
MRDRLTRLAVVGQLAAAILLSACTTTPRSPQLTKVPRSTQGAAAMLVRIGDSMRDGGDPRGAIALYRTANRRDPRYAPPLIHMGEAFNMIGDAPQAEAAFAAAAILAPYNTEAERGLAISLLREGRLNEALPLLQRLDGRSLAGRAPDADLLLAEGTALDMTGRSREAQAVYRRGLKIAPADARLHGNLSLSLALVGDLPDALHEMTLAIDAPEPDAREAANAVMVLTLAGQRQQAEAQGRDSVGAAETEILIARAESARGAPDAIGRARALGMIQGS